LIQYGSFPSWIFAFAGVGLLAIYLRIWIFSDKKQYLPSYQEFKEIEDNLAAPIKQLSVQSIYSTRLQF